ncbi:MAG: HU family DNA-binding protein [Syntrophomonadaceae bacterium]|nr:HU family DNA-binding protein [Syntrophomonadaceae bacterium]
MNKTELIAAVAKEAEVTKKNAEAVLNAFFKTVGIALKEGNQVSIIGFGTFKTAKRSERKGRDIRTGKEIKIPAMVVPTFKAGKGLKETVYTKPKPKKGKK